MPNPIPLASDRLSTSRIARYWEDGYLFPIEVMPADKAGVLRDELEQIEADWLDNGLALPLNIYKRVKAQCVLPIAHRIAVDPRLLNVVEGLLGPDILI